MRIDVTYFKKFVYSSKVRDQVFVLNKSESWNCINCLFMNQRVVFLILLISLLYLLIGIRSYSLGVQSHSCSLYNPHNHCLIVGMSNNTQSLHHQIIINLIMSSHHQLISLHHHFNLSIHLICTIGEME